MVSFTPRPLYPPGNSPRCPLNVGGYVGPRAGLDFWRTEKYSAPAGIETQFLRRPARSLVTILTELSQRTVGTFDKRFDLELGVGSLHCRGFPQLL